MHSSEHKNVCPPKRFRSCFNCCGCLLCFGNVHHLRWNRFFMVGLTIENLLSCQCWHCQLSFQHCRLFYPDSEASLLTYFKLWRINKVAPYRDRSFVEIINSWIEFQWMYWTVFLKNSFEFIKQSRINRVIRVGLHLQFNEQVPKLSSHCLWHHYIIVKNDEKLTFIVHRCRNNLRQWWFHVAHSVLDSFCNLSCAHTWEGVTAFSLF